MIRFCCVFLYLNFAWFFNFRIFLHSPLFDYLYQGGSFYLYHSYNLTYQKEFSFIFHFFIFFELWIHYSIKIAFEKYISDVNFIKFVFFYYFPLIPCYILRFLFHLGISLPKRHLDRLEHIFSVLIICYMDSDSKQYLYPAITFIF